MRTGVEQMKKQKGIEFKVLEGHELVEHREALYKGSKKCWVISLKSKAGHPYSLIKMATSGRIFNPKGKLNELVSSKIKTKSKTNSRVVVLN